MIKWLEGHFSISTFDKDISHQSWDSNLRTPCIYVSPGGEVRFWEVQNLQLGIHSTSEGPCMDGVTLIFITQHVHCIKI